MSDFEQLVIRETIISTCLDMLALDINQGTSGNVSTRIEKGFLITPSAMAYNAMLPDHIVELDFHGNHQSSQRPSSEWRLHRDIYSHYSEAQAIIHAHSTFCTALACLHRSIPAFHYMVAVAGGVDIRCAEYATFGTQALAENIIAALEDRRACLMANHGMICYGRDLDHALFLASEVETLAKQYWHACQLGTPTLLADEEMRQVIHTFETRYQPARA